MDTNSQIKSYVAIYWRVWSVLVALLLVIRFLIYDGYNEDRFFLLFTFYAIPTWLAIMILGFYEGHRLMEYLKMNHREKWEYLTYVPLFGPGGVNGFRSLPFLFSKDDLGDNIVLELKKNYRKFIKLALAVFFTLPFLFLLVMINWRR